MVIEHGLHDLEVQMSRLRCGPKSVDRALAALVLDRRCSRQLVSSILVWPRPEAEDGRRVLAIQKRTIDSTTLLLARWTNQ
jgi:hypothetical protein